MHADRSLALYKEAEVALAHLAIAADLRGPGPDNLLTRDEWRAVVALFPREGFADEFVGFLCGLCRDKPATTYDNIVGHFGLVYGLDGRGAERDDYTRRWRENLFPYGVMPALRSLEDAEQ
ncbi:hypothetical protein CDD83_6482 [Cordyceps sp. RAO-2017]|nr:hypothetical protein CDD83_6482 [Cordyceps sp. RAO-2017]